MQLDTSHTVTCPTEKPDSKLPFSGQRVFTEVGKNLLRHYAKPALTPRSLNVKLGPRRNYHKGRAVWLA